MHQSIFMNFIEKLIKIWDILYSMFICRVFIHGGNRQGLHQDQNQHPGEQ